MSRWLFRLAPWVLTLVVVWRLDVGGWRLEGGVSNVQSPISNIQLPTSNICNPVLYTLSADAAALTGSLALVEGDERPARAIAAAVQVRDLARQAATIEGGAELSWLLGDLATALERYAGGDPAAAPAVQAASARNAELRARCAGRAP